MTVTSNALDKRIMATGDDILSHIFSLPAVERADLARQLLLSLEPDEFGEEVQTAWGQEVERRSVAYRNGETESREWNQSIETIRESLKDRREK